MAKTRLQDSMRRKQEAFDQLMKDADPDDPTWKNAVIADTEIAWEIGAYDDRDERELSDLLKHDPLPDETREGILIRARRDAMAAKLHARDALFALQRIERELAEHRKVLVTTFLALAAFIAYTVWWR